MNTGNVMSDDDDQKTSLYPLNLLLNVKIIVLFFCILGNSLTWASLTKTELLFGAG